MAYDRIVVATEGSPCANRGVERAIDLAAESGATVHAVYVVDQGIGRPGDWDIVVERQEAEGEDALDTVGDMGAEAGVEVEKHLRRGQPAEQIVGFTEGIDADLIVMGTCGRSGFDRFRHAGSTTERVLRRSSVPVLAVPPDEST
ncbi:universal stress protein UspA [Halalkaliarchaeum desulfuricum]|uniref:Universal stress protein UspA n=1 Tax=Halalkaliarchaeum desulfuricum TaxID=2055893 RepID=A0A343TNE3_9EURY|nr:universal stress protein [Halalkaliarchaeum desulfuricum]AUX10615.1 universal stress protein UspA [Halalkaliarchaeum desulfuricum]